REVQRLGDRRWSPHDHDRRRAGRLAGHRRGHAGDRLRRLPGDRRPDPAHPGGARAARRDRGAGMSVHALPHHHERKTFLLVHGAWHAAAHWPRVAEELSARGHRVDALDLPGSGLDAGYPRAYLARNTEAMTTERSPIASIGLAEYRDAIVDRLSLLGPATLVGHSFGGLAITAAAEAVPHYVRRLVYLSAYVPAKHATGAELGALPEGATSLSGTLMIGDPSQTGATRIDPRNADPDYVEAG